MGEFVGVIKVENGKYICQTKQKFTLGDGFKILRDGKEVGGASYAGEVRGGIVLSSRDRLKSGDKAFITTDTALNNELLSQKRYIYVKISATFKAGECAEITIDGMKFYGEKPLESAQNCPLSVEDIKNCFNKIDKYPFNISFENIEADGVFVPASELNALRRNAYAKYFEVISDNGNIKLALGHNLPEINTSKNTKTAVICTSLRGVSADIGILKLSSLTDDTIKLTQGFKGEKFLFLPPFMTGVEIEQIKPIVQNFDGIYCDGLYGFKLSEELNKPLFVGTGMTLSNRVDVALCNAKYFAVSKELTFSEAQNLITDNAFCLSAGAIKVMDLIYCPFEKKCANCDMRELYTLTDGEGRSFPMRRYKVGACRFELYNCTNLVATVPDGAGTLLDCSLEENAQNLIDICKNSEKLKNYYSGNYTRGHSVKPVE